MVKDSLRSGALIFAAAWCGCAGDTAFEPVSSIALISPDNATDTISGSIEQPLLVEVRDQRGRPQANVQVRFQADSNAHIAATSGQLDWTTTVIALTGIEGRASVRVRLGTRAGPALVRASLADSSQAILAQYQVTPGGAVRLRVQPKDTIIGLGTSFLLLAQLVDRESNPRSDPVSIEADSPVVSIGPDQRVSGLRFGTTWIRVQTTLANSTRTDSARITVLPQARIAWSDPTKALVWGDLGWPAGLLLVPPDAVVPSWAPDGRRMVFSRLGALHHVDVSGVVSPSLTPGLNTASWPQYSADGFWIYFQSDIIGTRILRIQPDGSNLQVITPSRTGAFPSPSPDGSSVAYAAGGTGPLIVQHIATGTETAIPGTGGAQFPRWSPDGQWIAYTISPGLHLTLVRPKGTDPPRVLTVQLEFGFSWSPDSRWIVGSWLGQGRLVDLASGTTFVLPWTGSDPAWRR